MRFAETILHFKSETENCFKNLDFYVDEIRVRPNGGNLDASDDVLIGENIAVRGDDEAGARDGGGGGLAEEVLRGHLGRDADDLLAGGSVDIARAHGAGAGGLGGAG